MGHKAGRTVKFSTKDGEGGWNNISLMINKFNNGKKGSGSWGSCNMSDDKRDRVIHMLRTAKRDGNAVFCTVFDNK